MIHPTELHPDPAVSAEQAGLRYVHDDAPGISRRRSGKGFSYRNPDGTPVSKADLARINALALPPAYTDVWICADPNGHLQATGVDARGRKQYRYHPKWSEVRDQTKYHRMLAFGKSLPRIRKRAERDLAKTGLSREKVLAALVELLEKTMIRVGNEEYAKTNHSHGLTTLENKHVDVRGETVHFSFKGKSNKYHAIDLRDRKLARLITKLEDLPGQELFQFLDSEGTVHNITSADVNAYIKEISGDDFTAKDFRTWSGTVLASLALQEYERVDSQARAKRNVTAAIKRVSERLGNTPAICRKCYVHPAVIESYMDGSMAESFRQLAEEELRADLKELRPEEAVVLAFLERRLQTEPAG